MTGFRFLLLVALACQLTLSGNGQENAPRGDRQSPSGLEPGQWDAIMSRWIRAQPVVAVHLDGGAVVAGQPIHLDNDSLYIYPRILIPVGSEWQEQLTGVALAGADSLLLQRGGVPGIRQRRPRSYAVQPEYTEAGSLTRQKLYAATVYRDTLVPAADMKEAFRHSRLIRSVYPGKHVRFAAGVGFGGDVVTGEVKEALRDSPLGEPVEDYGTTSTIELIDIAFRFMNRFMAGWQYVTRPSYSTVSSYRSEPFFYSSYFYQVDLREHRFYGEFGLLRRDRYFSRRLEWTAGAGVILARPEMSFHYQYGYFPEGGQVYEDYQYTRIEGRFTGLLLKSALHWYIFPGLSLFAGIDAGLYQQWVIPELELSAPGSGADISVPEHRISLNALRFKTGIGIYL